MREDIVKYYSGIFQILWNIVGLMMTPIKKKKEIKKKEWDNDEKENYMEWNFN